MKNTRIVAAAVIAISILIWGLVELNKTTERYLYGHSITQNKIVNTIRLHKYGITGKNIAVGILGSGFYTKHPVFKNTRIIKEFDFAENKPTTLNYKHIKGLDHGTNIFSVIGGYKVNDLIGIAYGARFILAKSDKSTYRLAEEEINAVKASGWLVENGARIVTTSLSFNKFDDANYYYPDQMDGRTALITRTADSLFNKGVVFICSAGNKYEEDWHIIEPPADGFNVLAVGSIDKYLKHSFFSSCGPTADGRIKPDIVAPGEGIWVANYLPKFKQEYGWSHGTSLSAPIAAGVAALVLSAHPGLSNIQVVEAIKKSSSKADNPDNLYGWGVPDAEKAVSYFGPAFSNIPEINGYGDVIEIGTYVFSSYGVIKSGIELHLLVDKHGDEVVYKMEETDDNFFRCSADIKLINSPVKFYFKGKDKRGYSTKFPSGILGEYFILKESNGKLKISD
ncbi:MAG: S8 family serine peptidase [Ignavibacteriaceae bacterium]